MAVVAVAVVAFLAFRPEAELAGVRRPVNKGGGHVANPQFDTATPTSGAHLASAPACRDYTETLDPGLAVHALEHGAVLIWYQPGVATTLLPELTEVADAWDSHVLLSPNEDLDAPIVATAWNRLRNFETVDDDLREFVKTYRNRGPEKVDCDR